MTESYDQRKGHDMLILVLLAAITISGGIVLRRSVRLDTMFPSLAGGITLALGGVALLVCSVMVPLQQSQHRALIEEYCELKRAVEEAGAAARQMEDIYGQVVSMNRFLARARYWNDSLWTDWYWSDELAALPPIEIPVGQ